MHPYGIQVTETMTASISKERISPDDVIMYKSMEKTPFIYADNTKDLLAAGQRLSRCKAIVVDLENSKYTCLIQMSTRHEDIIIDVLKFESEIIRNALA